VDRYHGQALAPWRLLLSSATSRFVERWGQDSPAGHAMSDDPRDSREDRVGDEFAVADAHLLFVEGAPLEGGGRAPQLESRMQSACP
jgi:hypothetical protein